MQVFLNKDRGDRLCLRQVLPDDPIQAVREFLTAMAPVTQALAVDAQIAYRLGDLPYLAEDADPPRPRHHLRPSHRPANILVSSHCEAPEVSEVAELSIDRICAWLAQALDQPAPKPDYHPTLAGLEVFFTRTRLYSPILLDGQMTLLDGQATLAIPVKQQDDEAWVYGPVNGLCLYAPVFFKFSVEYGWLSVCINLTWGNLWTNPDTLEHHALKQALQLLTHQGWQLDIGTLPPILAQHFEL